MWLFCEKSPRLPPAMFAHHCSTGHNTATFSNLCIRIHYGLHLSGCWHRLCQHWVSWHRKNSAIIRPPFTRRTDAVFTIKRTHNGFPYIIFTDSVLLRLGPLLTGLSTVHRFRSVIYLWKICCSGGTPVNRSVCFLCLAVSAPSWILPTHCMIDVSLIFFLKWQ